MIKKNDFIEIEYTGRTEDDIIFDTTDEKKAKESGFMHEDATYGSVIVCIGQNQVIGELDDKLIGKDIGEHKITLTPEEGFGKKDAKLVQLIPTRKFKENDINPVIGLQVNIDGLMGMIKSVSGGRTLVDFNHPLSGQKLSYDIKIIRKVEDDNEKLKGYLEIALNHKNLKVDYKEGKASVEFGHDVPKESKETLEKNLKEIISGFKEIEFKKVEKCDSHSKDVTKE